MDMITGIGFQNFANNPASLASPAAIEQGKSLLSQLFGGSEALSDITTKAVEKTRLGGSVLSSMLPVVASLFMGYLSRNADGSSENAMDMLGSLAETGGVLGTLKGLANKMFG